MTLPTVKENEFIVIVCESSSGIILNLSDFSYYLNQGDDYYRIYNTLNEAKIKSLELMNSDKMEIEVTVLDYLNNVVEFFG